MCFLPSNNALLPLQINAFTWKSYELGKYDLAVYYIIPKKNH
jgi:hypothetical protein